MNPPLRMSGSGGLGEPASALAKAQSIHGVRAATSDVSTVAPHQILRPGGASR
jgi:hypothetical protein